MKKIAIIGAGISGLTAAWLLSRRHQVVLFEAENYVGGHTHTVSVSRPHGDYQVDTGFIVFNDRTYPGFNKLLDQLQVGRQATSMGFSVSCDRTGLEYSGDGLGGFFAQRRNILSPRHWRLLQEILRFNRDAPQLLADGAEDLTLGRLLELEGYSEHFRHRYLLAMGSAIWSCGEQHMEDFPARFFVEFFRNHGLLSLKNRPQWYVVPGGSARYVDAMLARLNVELRIGTAVKTVSRNPDGVRLATVASGPEEFDEVVFACHSDQALALLEDADDTERNALSNVPYQENEVVLHTDDTLLPENRRTWSSWNALLPRETSGRVEVTYNMNILQGIQAPETFCVTLNSSERIADNKVLGRYTFFHPLFTRAGLASREVIARANGRRHTWFCGAWCGNGFHEDGVQSALAVSRAFGEEL
jgi:predicted NAD/FAD-binding protein